LRFLRIAVFALALDAASAADAATQVELIPAWGGWSRPGRVTEIRVRARTDVPTRIGIEIVSGTQSLHAPLELAPGDAPRYEVNVPASTTLESVIEIDGAEPERRPIALSLSESPLLAVALADGRAPTLPSFHSVAVATADLPRTAAAYGSVDAVAIDGSSIRALDPQQLVALIGYAAGCGRLALVAPTPDVLRLLEGSAGCGARLLVSGPTPDQTLALLAETLASPSTLPASAADLNALLRPEASTWPTVVASLAAYFGIATLVLLLTRSTTVMLLIPMLAALAMSLLLRTAEPHTRLVIWAEAAPAVRVAQYQAWQEVTGTRRAALDIPLLAGLGHPHACDTRRPARLEVDAVRGRLVTATFEGRLFDPVAVCYAGHFPVMRAVGVTPRADGTIEIRNEGTLAWPPGSFVTAGTAQPLPALGPGASVTLRADHGHPPQEPAQRAALARTPFGGYGVLWPLALDTVADAPASSAAWLLVPIEGPT
jgi:hypothetical protein